MKLKVGIIIDEKLYERAKEVARSGNHRISSVIERALEQFFRQEAFDRVKKISGRLEKLSVDALKIRMESRKYLEKRGT